MDTLWVLWRILIQDRSRAGHPMGSSDICILIFLNSDICSYLFNTTVTVDTLLALWRILIGVGQVSFLVIPNFGAETKILFIEEKSQ